MWTTKALAELRFKWPALATHDERAHVLRLLGNDMSGHHPVILYDTAESAVHCRRDDPRGDDILSRLLNYLAYKKVSFLLLKYLGYSAKMDDAAFTLMAALVLGPACGVSDSRQHLDLKLRCVLANRAYGDLVILADYLYLCERASTTNRPSNSIPKLDAAIKQANAIE